MYEPGAALETNNSQKTVLQYARDKDLGTLGNRPLNAFFRTPAHPPGGLSRTHEDRDIVGDFKKAMSRATVLEASYPARKVLPAQNIAWGHATPRKL